MSLGLRCTGWIWARSVEGLERLRARRYLLHERALIHGTTVAISLRSDSGVGIHIAFRLGFQRVLEGYQRRLATSTTPAL